MWDTMPSFLFVSLTLFTRSGVALLLVVCCQDFFLDLQAFCGSDFQTGGTVLAVCLESARPHQDFSLPGCECSDMNPNQLCF